MRRDGGSVFPAHANTGDPNGPLRGLSANQNARALISMMARSTTRSNLRPDTLMQDRICQVDETSCNARPDHTLGQTEKTSRRANAFRFTPDSRPSMPSLAARICRSLKASVPLAAFLSGLVPLAK